MTCHSGHLTAHSLLTDDDNWQSVKMLPCHTLRPRPSKLEKTTSEEVKTKVNVGKHICGLRPWDLCQLRESHTHEGWQPSLSSYIIVTFLHIDQGPAWTYRYMLLANIFIFLASSGASSRTLARLGGFSCWEWEEEWNKRNRDPSSAPCTSFRLSQNIGFAIEKKIVCLSSTGATN